MDAINSLLTEYSLPAIIIILILVLVAVKFLSELIIWFYEKAKNFFKKKNDEEQKELTQSKVTADNYVKVMNELIYYFDDCEVKTITKEDAYDFLDYLLNDKVHYRGDPRRSDKIGLALEV